MMMQRYSEKGATIVGQRQTGKSPASCIRGDLTDEAEGYAKREPSNQTSGGCWQRRWEWTKNGTELEGIENSGSVSRQMR